MSEAALTANIVYERSSQRWMADFIGVAWGLVALAMQAVMEVKPHRQAETFLGCAIWVGPSAECLAAEPFRKQSVPQRTTTQNQCLGRCRSLHRHQYLRSWSGGQSFKRFRLRKSPRE